jgi:hypothetical protein
MHDRENPGIVVEKTLPISRSFPPGTSGEANLVEQTAELALPVAQEHSSWLETGRLILPI